MNLENAAVLGIAILTIAFLIQAANGVLGIIRHFRAEPPADRLYATKEELARVEARSADELRQIHGRMSGMRNEISGEIRALRIALDESVTAQRQADEKVHERTNTILQAVSELKGEMKALTR